MYVIVLCLFKTLYVCLPPFLCMKCCPACLYFSSYCLLAGRPSQPFVYVYQPVYHCPPLGGGICKTPIPVQKKIISILEAQILCCLHHFVFDFVTCFVTKRWHTTRIPRFSDLWKFLSRLARLILFKIRFTNLVSLSLSFVKNSSFVYVVKI